MTGTPSVASLLQEAVAQLATDTPRLDAELLLAHAMACDRLKLRTFPEAPVTPEAAACFAGLMQRRRQGEPIAYLLGRRGFWTLDLEVDPHTLIPRPDTELLVETALELGGSTAQTVLDLGTGSGAVILALAMERPAWQCTAVDMSLPALAVARRNAAAHHLAVRFLQGDWLMPLAGERFGLIVSNPPYIADSDVHLGQGDLRYEPRTALASGADGLDDIRRIVADAPGHLEPQGWLLFEHGFDQGERCRELMCQRGFRQVVSRRDIGGHERVTLGQWQGA